MVSKLFLIFAAFYITLKLSFRMEERKIYSELPNIEAFMCVLGLTFPESATEFQKATLTLAHLYATIRDYVLKGVEVPGTLIELADSLNTISYDERCKQR